MEQLTNNFKDTKKALKKHIQEVRHVEQQLQQIQKSESLSRMAGAIAHNFNNQLSVVLGNLIALCVALREIRNILVNLWFRECAEYSQVFYFKNKSHFDL